MTKVLVAGASGYLGMYVAKEFKKQGYHTSALARSSVSLGDIAENIDEQIICDATDKYSLGRICDNIDIVFSSIGITKQKDGLTFMDVDYQANKNLLDEAVHAGVKKFIYISVFGAERMKKLKGVQAKLKFEQELIKSGIDYTIVYPNGFFSDMKEYLEMAKKGRGIVLGSGEFRINPIHGADLAEICVKAADDTNQKIHVGGPEIFTHREIFGIAFDLLKKKPKVSGLPLWMKSLMLGLLRLFTSEKTYGPLEFFTTVLSNDLIAPKYGTYKLREFYKEQLIMSKELTMTDINKQYEE